MQPSGDKGGAPTAELRYRAPGDELSVVYGPAGDIDFGEYVEDVSVSFARGRDAQLVAVHVRALTFARPVEWREQVRALVGRTVWRRATALAHEDLSASERIVIPAAEWRQLRSEVWPSARAAILD